MECALWVKEGKKNADDADPKGTRIFADLKKSAKIRVAEHQCHPRSNPDKLMNDTDL